MKKFICLLLLLLLSGCYTIEIWVCGGHLKNETKFTLHFAQDAQEVVNRTNIHGCTDWQQITD